MRSFTILGAAALLLAPPLVSQQTYVVDPYGGGTHTTITAAAAAADSGDTILIKPHTDDSQQPPAAPTGYSETHHGGTETFPIWIDSGVTVKHYGTGGIVAIWSSAATPPDAIFQLGGVSSGTAPLTRMEDLFIFGGKRGIQIMDADGTNEFSDFLGVIARCQFAWNQIAIDLIDDNTTTADLAIRDCKIRSALPILPTGSTPPPVFQAPSVGLRFHALGNSDTNNPPIVNVEIRNLQTIGDFETMDPTGVDLSGYHDISGGNLEFTRLVEVFVEASGFHLEHSPATGFAPIPAVNLDFIGGDLQGMADPNDTNAGWGVGIVASTGRSTSVELKDFSAGYRIETSGTIFDGFKFSGVHCVSTRWGRAEATLNGNTIVRETGRQATGSASDDIYNGVHMTTLEAYTGLHATGANVTNNKGNGIYLRTQSSILASDHAAPTGNFINLEDCSISQNVGNGIALGADIDGIVGGAWHFVNSNRSLRKDSAYDYSVDYGQGIVNGCAISNNDEAGLFFRPTSSATFVNARFTNCIIWNNPFGGYLADLTGEDNRPTLLAPLGHCTLAGNGDSGSYPYSLEIIEEDRAGGDFGTYYWSGPGGVLTTKFYNTVLERKSSSALDFAPGMISGPNAFLLDDLTPPSSFEIGAAGLRYQDGGSGPTIFGVSTRDTTPFVNSSSWTTLDPTRFYLLNHGANGVFGKTPTIFPLVGNETAFDHEGDLRPVASGGTRDKGADELQ